METKFSDMFGLIEEDIYADVDRIQLVLFWGLIYI